MKLNFSVFTFTLFLICKSVYASDCNSFKKSLDIQNEAMEYVTCDINHEKQGVPVELMYRFKGTDAQEVERYLIEKFNINPIERKRAHAFWSSYKSYEPEKNLQIRIGTNENFHDTRDKWIYIDYFYIQFSEDTEDI